MFLKNKKLLWGTRKASTNRKEPSQDTRQGKENDRRVQDQSESKYETIKIVLNNSS